MPLPAMMGGAVGGAASVAQKLTSAMTPKPAATTTPGTTNASSMGTSTTPSGTSYSNDEITSAAPLYSGPHVAPIPHVASALGASYTHNANDGTYNVNGQTVKPTSIVNGVGHAPVTQLAQVMGHPMSLVTSNAKGTTVMPNNTQSGKLNQYWTNVKNQGGAYANPTANGMTVDQQVQNEAKLYGINPSQVQVIHEKDGSVRTFVPWQLAQAHAIAASNPQPTQPTQPAQQQPQQPAYDPMAALQANQGQFLQNMYGSAPQAPALQPMPTLDTSQFQPFQWNMGQDYANVYSSLDPTYQQQMATADQKINDAMNRRGIYTSGIAQQAVDQQNNALTGTEWNAINKQVNSDQGNALKAWQDNNMNQLNAYKDQLDAAYKSGQLTNQQYADEINKWSKLVSAQTSMSGQDASMIGKTLPYNMGPTPAQLLAYEYQTANNAANNQTSMNKALLPYTMGMTPEQQAQMAYDYYKTNLPYNSMTQYQQGQLNLGNAKLQAQVQQWQAADMMRQESITGYDANGNPTLDRQKFDQTVTHDNQLIQDAMANISNNTVKTQLEGLNQQLGALDTQIKAFTAAVPPQAVPQSIINQRDGIMQQIESIVIAQGSTDSTAGNASYSPGSPLVTPN